MVYNAKNEKEMETKLPKDEILNGVIISIKDGTVKDFVAKSAHDQWKGSLEQKAIEVYVQIKVGEDTETIKQMFTYSNDEDNKTIYGANSNLGKYKAKYEKLPETSDIVKVKTDSKGFGKIKLD